MDLNISRTFTYAGDAEPAVVTPKIRTRVRDGVVVTSVRRIEVFFADRIEAITDEGDRTHALEMLRGAAIFIADAPDGPDSPAEGRGGGGFWREHGRLTTTYDGSGLVSVDDVLDLAAEIRAALDLSR
ncbi:hypothetical protein ACFY97_18630 [Streptomyces klenkii]|uniref:hypothetical protein n=1 Tax=Streptomyces klenkii TaxID=1420899 RepID=UPI0036E7B89C